MPESTARPVSRDFHVLLSARIHLPLGTLCRMLSVVRAFRSSALAALVLVAGVLVVPSNGTAQSDTLPHSKALIVGERLEYEVKFGPIKVGRASMEVVDVEEVR